MSQRNSGYARLPDDVYETPAWVTMALQPHMRGVQYIWEPACGHGQMARMLATWPGVRVRATDKSKGIDFLAVGNSHHDAIITNPPYSHAQEFIEHALKLVKPYSGRVAMLLRNDYDSAKTRQHLFRDCKQWARKVVLTSRIKWIADSTGSPSYNHSWFIWDWTYNEVGARIAYHVRAEAEELAEERAA